MKKIFLIFIILLFPITVSAYTVDIESKSAILVRRDNNEILYEKNKDEKLPIASLTKIMTTIVALENINDLNKTVVITESDLEDLYDYTVVDLSVGDAVPYIDLLYSTIMKSAADSSNALANNVFGNYDEFINKMNELASNLNMTNTHFSNPIGKDDNNYSTSYDLYLLLDYALENENFLDIYTCKEYTMRYNEKKITNNMNNLIKKYEIDNYGINFLGTKTGFTTLSGLSLSGLTKLNNYEMIFVDIGAPGEYKELKNVKDGLNVLNYLKNNYEDRVVVQKDKLIDTINYKKRDKIYNYEIRTTKNHKYYMDKNYDINYLKIYYNGKISLDKNIKENDYLGDILVYYNNNLISSEKVYFSKKNIIKEEIEYKKILLIVGICIVGLVIFKPKKKKKIKN